MGSSPLTRDGIRAPLPWEHRVLGTGPPEKYKSLLDHWPPLSRQDLRFEGGKSSFQSPFGISWALSTRVAHLDLNLPFPHDRLLWFPSKCFLTAAFPFFSALDTFIPKILLCPHTSLFKFLKAGSPVYGLRPRWSLWAEKGALWNKIDSTQSNSCQIPLPLLCPLPPLPGFLDPSFRSSEPTSCGLFPRRSTVSIICRIPGSSLQLRGFPLQSLPSCYLGPSGSQNLQL